MEKEIKERKKRMMQQVEKELPELAHKIKVASKEGIKNVLWHQDAYAGDYQTSEFQLLGCAVKYAGEFGVTVTVHGKNQETIK